MRKPGDTLALLKSLKEEWKWLFRYVLQYRRQILFYVVSGVLGTVMGLGVSLASKYLIDAVVTHNQDTIVFSACLAVGMAVAQIVMNTVTGRITTLVGTKVNQEIKGDMYERILFSRWDQIGRYHSGELINRMEGDVSAVSNGIISFIPSIFTRVTQFVGSFVIVLWYDPTMAVLALVSAPFLLAVSRISSRMIRKYSMESREMSGRLLSNSEEAFQNLQTIKAFDLTRHYTERFRTLLGEYRTLLLKQNKFSLTLTLYTSLVGMVVSYLCYGWGVWRLWQGAISYGTMTLFLQLSGQLTGSFASLVALAPSLITIGTAAGRIMELHDLPEEQDADRVRAEAMLPLAEKRGIAVEARQISYTYPDGLHPVIREADFRAEPNEIIGLVGPSGEGKTTLLRLLLGLIQPGSGSLTMGVPGGEPLPVSESTRRFCSYVPQNHTVFTGTIAENLRIVRPEAGDAELIRVLQQAEAWDFVRALPRGLETEVGERGVNFSQGQLQRLGIARALLRRAPVLIMDEVTSALDTETEQRVLENILAARENRTCILTTHRPSMLQYCTRVYRITSQGQIVLEP